MLLIGLETKQVDNKLNTRFFTLSPIKNKVRVGAFIGLLWQLVDFNKSVLLNLQDASGVDQELLFDASTCSSQKWQQRFQPTYDGSWLYAMFFAFGESGPPFPYTFTVNYPFIGFDTAFLTPQARVFGSVPILTLLAQPGRLIAKPGDTVLYDISASISAAGGTMLGKITNVITGKSAEEVVGQFNAGDSINLSSEDTMPGLLPDEVANIDNVIGISVCEGSIELDESREQIMASLKETVPSLVTRTIVQPTSALLADISSGVVQVLGDNLTFSGFVISDEQKGPISGQSPSTISFKGLQYLKLEFSRDIAICENRNILEANGRVYEYSTFPTPFMTFQRAKFAVSTYRPASPWEGPPLPITMVERPKIKVRG